MSLETALSEIMPARSRRLSRDAFTRSVRETTDDDSLRSTCAQARWYGIEYMGNDKFRARCEIPGANRGAGCSITFGVYDSAPEVPTTRRCPFDERRVNNPPDEHTPPLSQTQAAAHFNVGTKIVSKPRPTRRVQNTCRLETS